MITLRFFASLREALHTAEEKAELPAAISTVGALRAHLAGRGGEWARLGAASNLRYAVNQEMADDSSPVKPGDEVAFFPPVTGG